MSDAINQEPLTAAQLRIREDAYLGTTENLSPETIRSEDTGGTERSPKPLNFGQRHFLHFNLQPYETIHPRHTIRRCKAIEAFMQKNESKKRFSPYKRRLQEASSPAAQIVNQRATALLSPSKVSPKINAAGQRIVQNASISRNAALISLAASNPATSAAALKPQGDLGAGCSASTAAQQCFTAPTATQYARQRNAFIMENYASIVQSLQGHLRGFATDMPLLDRQIRIQRVDLGHPPCHQIRHICADVTVRAAQGLIYHMTEVKNWTERPQYGNYVDPQPVTAKPVGDCFDNELPLPLTP